MRTLKESVSILVVRGAGRRNISFNLRFSTLKILVFLLSLLILFLFFFVYYFGRISFQFATVSAIKRENELLKSKMLAVDSIILEIDRIRSFENKIKRLTKNYSDSSSMALSYSTPDLFSRDEGLFDRDVDGYVQKIRLHRDRNLSSISDPLEKRRLMFSSAPNLLPVEGWVSRGYLFSDNNGGHHGMDIAAESGSPIRASGPGIITFSGWHKDMGFLLEIDHGYGLLSRYGHCSRLIVKKGDLVERGQTIATVGNTGRSSAPHLHFEIILEGRRVDPMIYLLR